MTGIKITFGKYKNQDLSIVNDDENYKNWLLKQDFFKDKYPEEYKYLKNYPMGRSQSDTYKKPINFFECMYKNLDNDCLDMVSDYLKVDEYYNYLSFTFRADLIDHKIKTAFKHRQNLLEVITILNNKPKKLTPYNLFEFRLFHENNLERFMYTCFNNGITRGDDLYNKQYDYLLDNMYDKVRNYKDYKVGFGKYKDTTYEKLYSFRGNNGYIDYRMKRWVEWAKEKNVLDNRPLLKFYMDFMQKLDYTRLQRNTYYN